MIENKLVDLQNINGFKNKLSFMVAEIKPLILDNQTNLNKLFSFPNINDNLKLEFLDIILKEKIRIWKSLENDKQSEYYVSSLLPLLAKKRENEYIEKFSELQNLDCLISTVGTSIEPICFTIFLLKPKKIFLLHTDKTVNHVDKIVSLLKLKASDYERSRISAEEPDKFYEQIRKIKSSIPSGAKVAVDMTGGQKTMAAMASMAAFAIKIPAVYVRSEFENRHSKPDSESLEILKNPYSLLGDEAIPKIIALFNSRQYIATQQLCSNVADEILESKPFEIMSDLAKSFDFLKNLDLKEAFELLGKCVNKSKRFNLLKTVFVKVMPIFGLLEKVSVLKNEKEIFSDIIKARKSSETIRKSVMEAAYSIIIIMYKIGVAELEVNKNYDTACLLFYRTWEYFQQIAFAFEFGVKTKDFDYSKINISKEELNSKVKEVFDMLYQKNSFYTELPVNVGLLSGAVLIHVTGIWNMIKTHEILKEIKAFTEVRNNSKFAHGTASISFEEANNMKELIKSQLLFKFPDKFVSKKDKQKLICDVVINPVFSSEMLM